jgi:hypothetical protein
MATAAEIARKLYPRMASSGSGSPAGALASRKDFGQIAREIYPTMAHLPDPKPPEPKIISRTPPRTGFVTRRAFADARTGRIFYIEE